MAINTTMLSTDDVKDITTAMLTIERLLTGQGDADMHAAAKLLKGVLDRNDENDQLYREAEASGEMDAIVSDFLTHEAPYLKGDTSMKTFLHIPANGPVTTFKVTPDNELHELQNRVGGYIASGGTVDGHILYVDDEGLMKGYAPNYTATLLAKQALVGDAVLVGPIVGDGDASSVTPEMIDRVMDM